MVQNWNTISGTMVQNWNTVSGMIVRNWKTISGTMVKNWKLFLHQWYRIGKLYLEKIGKLLCKSEIQEKIDQISDWKIVLYSWWKSRSLPIFSVSFPISNSFPIYLIPYNSISYRDLLLAPEKCWINPCPGGHFGFFRFS